MRVENTAQCDASAHSFQPRTHTMSRPHQQAPCPFVLKVEWLFRFEDQKRTRTGGENVSGVLPAVVDDEHARRRASGKWKLLCQRQPLHIAGIANVIAGISNGTEG
eukprot:1865939-Rhodomonas_salina.2